MTKDGVQSIGKLIGWEFCLLDGISTTAYSHIIIRFIRLQRAELRQSLTPLLTEFLQRPLFSWCEYGACRLTIGVFWKSHANGAAFGINMHCLEGGDGAG